MYTFWFHKEAICRPKDYPHSAKAKKHFLVIYATSTAQILETLWYQDQTWCLDSWLVAKAGLSGEQPANMPEPMEDEEEQAGFLWQLDGGSN